jgi:hypothetical protein
VPNCFGSLNPLVFCTICLNVKYKIWYFSCYHLPQCTSSRTMGIPPPWKASSQTQPSFDGSFDTTRCGTFVLLRARIRHRGEEDDKSHAGDAPVGLRTVFQAPTQIPNLRIDRIFCSALRPTALVSCPRWRNVGPIRADCTVRVCPRRRAMAPPSSQKLTRRGRSANAPPAAA